MADTIALFAMTPRDLGLLVVVALATWLIGLFIFWLFYGLCSLGAGLSMRLGYTFGTVLFLICILWVFRNLREYFAWWHYTPHPQMAVIADFVIIVGLALVWLILMWSIFPRPRRGAAEL